MYGRVYYRLTLSHRGVDGSVVGDAGQTSVLRQWQWVVWVYTFTNGGAFIMTLGLGNDKDGRARSTRASPLCWWVRVCWICFSGNVMRSIHFVTRLEELWRMLA